MFTKPHPLLLSITLLVVAIFLRTHSAEAATPPFEAFAASDAVRVFEDGYGQPARQASEIRVFGVRNEIVSAQCVVAAREDLKSLTVALGPLQHRDGSATLAADLLEWNYVTSIFVEANTPKLRPSDLVRPAPARFPDCLSSERTCSVKKGSFKAIYLTIHIPRQASPGDYRGDVTLTSGPVTVRLPLVLTVYPVTLPDERHLLVTEWFSTGRFQQHHGIDPRDSERFFKMLQVYARNMAEHRQNVFRVDLNLIQSTQTADGKFHFDSSLFDRWAQVFWDTGRMDRLETGFIAHFGQGGWSSHQILLNDFRVQEQATDKMKRVLGKDFLPQFLPALVAHLDEKKWLNKTLFHICDEPSNANVMAWREASDFVHRHAPQLRRLDAIETPHCLGCLEVWIPKLDHLSTWEGAYEEARRQGNEMWFYTVGIFQGGSLPNKTVDVPLIESRLLHWLNYRYGLKGYLHWGFNAWTDDPINAPGEHRGDGWHVYPIKEGLLNSLRWEQMRNGIQDYECLWLLESRIAQVKATLSPRVAGLIGPSRRGLEIASQVVRTYSDYTRDPKVLSDARRQVIKAIVDLDMSPRVILQTNPLEHSVVARNCAIDIHGWVEPGTSVKIGGRETPVAADGLFLGQTTPSREGTIVVEAESAKGRKTFVRNFRLLDDGSSPNKKPE